VVVEDKRGRLSYSKKTSGDAYPTVKRQARTLILLYWIKKISVDEWRYVVIGEIFFIPILTPSSHREPHAEIKNTLRYS